MLSDFRFAFRQLAKSPGFTVIAVLTLALGIGLNTSLFSLLNGIFYRPLPYPQADQLIRVHRSTPQIEAGPHSAADFLDLKREAAGTVRLAAYRLWSFTLAEPSRPARLLEGLRVSADFFQVLGVPPAIGSLFTAENDEEGATPVVVLSHRVWQSDFAGDPQVIGRMIRMDGQPTRVIGVMPPSFAAPVVWGPADAWCPLRLTADERRNRGETPLGIVGRCAAGVSLDQAASRLRAVSAQLARDFPKEDGESSVRLRPLRLAGVISAVDTFRQMSWFTLALAGSVLLITCANLANLQLGRAVRRGREYAVCSALGASRTRLMRPIVCECLLLSLAGGAVGLIIVLWTNDWLGSRFDQLPGIGVSLDWRVFFFASSVSLATGILFSVVPAWIISRLSFMDILKSGGRTTTGGRSQSRYRDALIVGQFALALVLLAAAGFFHVGAARLLTRDPGWRPEGVLQGILSLPSSRYPDDARTYDFYQRLQERLATLPGVEHVSVSWTLPIFDYLQTNPILVDGRDNPPAGREPIAYVNGITPSFLDTTRLRLVAGRNFSALDDGRAPAVALVNESAARTLFPGEDPVGRRIRTADGKEPRWLEVVGVVRDAQYAANFASPVTRLQVYRPLAQVTWTYVTVALRSNRPEALAEPLRQAVASLDPDIPVQRLGTAMDAIGTVVQNFTRGTKVLAGLAVLGLFLAAIGIYGVIANLVIQRTPEIGIRIALGAPVHSVVWLVLGTGLRLALIGIALGLLGTYLVALVLRSIAPELPAQDAWLAGGVTLLLLVVAAVASGLPARRATRIDPIEALRAE